MTDNPFQLKFTLQQHTPIIHFQHEQAGATLRATELKPKLDLYLMGHLLQKAGMSCEQFEVRTTFKKEAKDRAEWRRWLVGLGHQDQEPALNYKVKIVPASAPVPVAMQPSTDKKGKWQTKFPAFFANMGTRTREELKNFVMYDQVTIYITAKSLGLKDLIEKEFHRFLMYTNFGTRQSKGFGCFYLHPNDPQFERQTLKYSFTVDVGGARNELQKQQWLFESIDLFYRSMRSGINLKGRNRSDVMYLKSLMAQFSFRDESKIQWDKKPIRDHFELTHSTYQEARRKRDSDSTFHYTNQKPPRLMRDMLGLSSEESWFAYSDAISKKSNDIGRFKSPIIFKPIKTSRDEFEVYFEGLKIPKKYYGQSFSISHNPRRGEQKPSKNFSTPLNEGEFSLDEFLEFVYSKRDTIEDPIDTGYGDVEEANILIDLFASLKKHA